MASDLISRKALIEAYDKAHKGPPGGARKLMEDAPGVDAVEVVHGEWETVNDGTHLCTHCGCDAPYTWDDIDRNFIDSADDVPDRPSNYCPHCGAKMEAKEGEG